MRPPTKTHPSAQRSAPSKELAWRPSLTTAMSNSHNALASVFTFWGCAAATARPPCSGLDFHATSYSSSWRVCTTSFYDHYQLYLRTGPLQPVKSITCLVDQLDFDWRWHDTIITSEMQSFVVDWEKERKEGTWLSQMGALRPIYSGGKGGQRNYRELRAEEEGAKRMKANSA